MSAGAEPQVFGFAKGHDTRAALRFFAERRIRVHFVDLAVRAASPRELERFARAFGVEALIDRGSPRFAELGLGAASYSEERWLELLTREPRLLRLPLVRWGARLSVGRKDAEWRAWGSGERGTGNGERGKGKRERGAPRTGRRSRFVP